MLSNSCNSSMWPQMWPQAKIKLVFIPPESNSYVTQVDICRELPLPSSFQSSFGGNLGPKNCQAATWARLIQAGSSGAWQFPFSTQAEWNCPSPFHAKLVALTLAWARQWPSASGKWKLDYDPVWLRLDLNQLSFEICCLGNLGPSNVNLEVQIWFCFPTHFAPTPACGPCNLQAGLWSCL